MNFPFETQIVQEMMTNRPLVMSSNFPSSKEFRVVQEISLFPDGSVAGNFFKGKWEVMDGVLRLLSNKGHLVTEYRILETRNGCVYAVGRNVLEPVGVSARPILHIKMPIQNDFGICIASNIHYEKVAVPRILRSLEGEGFEMDRIVVVVGNDAKNDQKVGIDPEMKVMAVRRKNDIFGMTALGNVPDINSKPYWLLLHDTCEVTVGFAHSIASLDVGLNPDMVVFRPLDEKMEFGLYAAQFAQKMGDMPIGTKPFDYFGLITQKAEIITVLSTSIQKEPEKDVYGRGIRRETLYFPSLGLKKYRAKQPDVKRP